MVLSYIYVNTLTSKNKVNYTVLFHFAPFLLSSLLFSDYYFLSTEAKMSVIRNKGAGYEFHLAVNLVVIIVSGIVYVLLSAIKLRNYKRNLKQEFSFTEKINLDWLTYLITGMGVIWLVVLSRIGDNYIFAAVVIYVIFIGYFGIKQVGIFSQSNIESPIQEPVAVTHAVPMIVTVKGSDDSNNIEINVSNKYQKSPLSEDAALKIHEALKARMLVEKLFKDPELTLSQLAERLNIHPNYLSQVINTFEKKNFYEYINEQRIQEFIKEISLPQNKNFTILSLAFDCGFNSKTSFNRNFKKVTGTSPSEYLNQKQITTT